MIPPPARPLRGIILNAILLEVGWGVTVVAAADGNGLLGPAVVAIILALHWGINRPCNGEIVLIGLATLWGLAIDSVLIQSGFLGIEDRSSGLAPLWLVALWANLATGINWCLRWLDGRRLLQFLFGAVGGPLAYYAGSRIGALNFPGDLVPSIAILAAVWAFTIPLLFATNTVLRRRLGDL